MNKLNLQSRITLHTGNTMPVIGLGTWKLTKHTEELVEKGIELGYRMIDTSGDYGTQPAVGEALANIDLPRTQLYIVTKVEENEDAYLAAKKNLDELKLTRADLILIHRPPENGAGKALWRGLLQAKKEGYATDIGLSNYSIPLIEELIETTGEVPVVNQIEWSPFGWSEKMLNFAKERGIVIMAYSPLTHGKRLDDETLQNIASKYNKTPAHILIRWNLQLGTVPVVKAGKEEHMKENIDVFDFELSDEDMAALNGLNEEFSALGEKPQYLEVS